MFKVHVLLRIALCFLFIFVPLHGLDEWFYDRFFSLRHPSQDNHSPFVLIRVTNANLVYGLGRENVSPKNEEPPLSARSHTRWHEDFYNNLLARIERDEPRVIVFTSFFDSVDSPTQELSYPNILFSAYLNEEYKLIPPPLQFIRGENYGFSNIFADSDNVVRKAHLVYSSGSSLALRTYHRIASQPVKRNLLDPLYIDYRGPAGTYPIYDAREVLDGEVAPGLFRNRIVLIGREGSQYSEYETPLGRMSKQEIQANILDTFMQDREIRILPRWVTLILASVAVLSSVGIILYFPLTLAWLFLLLESLLILLISLFVFSYFKYWAGVGNPLLCVFTTHLLMLGYKLSRQEEEQWRVEQEAQYLREMDHFKNNFISLFSHDLKTPIAKIKAITERLLNEHPDFDGDVKDSLKTIERTNSELARFISDILKVTKMEAMRLEPSKDVIDLNRLVEEAVRRLKFMADEKQISLVVDLEPLFSMEGDRHLIQEVITNLVENAIKYSPSNRKVIIRTHEEDRRVWVSVIDEGAGIPSEELPRVTTKFYRGKAVADSIKGSGLGLYLSKYFVELHRGGLNIRSQVGEGTEVSFWLPLPA